MSKSERIFTPCKIGFEIESLGPIRDSVIRFEPFLLFSGESNTAKSYTAMAVYYLFFMLNNEKIITELTLKLFDTKQIESDLRTKRTVESKLPEELLSELQRLYNENIGRFMAYMLGNDDFSCKVKLTLKFIQTSDSTISLSLLKGKTGGFEIKFSARLPNDNWDYISENSQSVDTILENNLKFFVSGLCTRLLFKTSYRQFLLPPARGAFSGLTSSVLKKFSGIGMYNEFLEGIDSVRFSSFDIFNEAMEEQIKFINPLFEELINGKIKVEKDSVSYTVTGSDEQIPLTAGSSSVKELFPLYLILNRVLMERLSICIEEPEAHLHPELQRSAALLLVYIVNRGGFIQVTTHSDFFVNQVNNLLKLHFIKNKNSDEFQRVLEKTGIRKEFLLNPEDMGAYFFEKTKNHVRVRELNVSDKGMPMESFKRVYDQSVNETRSLREALSDNEE
jgi:predicted ATPase